ncbi:AbrB/MazE/SpoVT family DNA-binding domain-containing protein [Faecalibaculum rodentium]|uniref:AbrB/MazE/SpoVT family DNA-binding domain-containing protein n=1 Tax=Faecalibaculum rodentium TaxID=1702221 RepID=UPI0026F3F07C|nr:AbrB/MazE/SpoVT family DNA-binding domain-containing protein [Faecalibaculum rodentium]
MNETQRSGIIRRFDDLGRIVVPREIRKLLQLHEGDAMEVSVAGNSIRLDRHQPLRFFWEALCGPCLTVFCRNFQLACAICDTEHVLASRVTTIPKGSMLSQTVKDHIRALEPYFYSPGSQIPLLEDGSHMIDTLFPAGTKGQPIGAVVLPHYRTVTEEERICARLLADILTETIIQEEKNI